VSSDADIIITRRSTLNTIRVVTPRDFRGRFVIDGATVEVVAAILQRFQGRNVEMNSDTEIIITRHSTADTIGAVIPWGGFQGRFVIDGATAEAMSAIRQQDFQGRIVMGPNAAMPPMGAMSAVRPPPPVQYSQQSNASLFPRKKKKRNSRPLSEKNNRPINGSRIQNTPFTVKKPTRTTSRSSATQIQAPPPPSLQEEKSGKYLRKLENGQNLFDFRKGKRKRGDNDDGHHDKNDRHDIKRRKYSPPDMGA